ncbi:MAG: hypothetical protein LBQ42_12560 [Synergistaceae bacterium]|jgi:hypothetical protein|nr:hypothetical protein [Synergistaceae bacterium]
MIPWDYDDSQYSKDDTFPLVPEGEYPVKILEVKYQESQTKKDMYVLKVKLLDLSGILFYYLVFDPENSGMTHQNLGRIYDSFDIPKGEMDGNQWVGKVGAAKVEHEEYKGKPQARIARFLTRERQEELGFLTPRDIEEGVFDLDDDLPL